VEAGGQEIGGYGRRRQWKYRPPRPLRAHFRADRFNCPAFRKGPRNHIGALADGNPRHSPLFTVRRLTVIAEDAAKKQAPGNRVGGIVR
jgi:hypothetical protein